MPSCCGTPPPYDSQPPDPEQFPAWGLWVGPVIAAMLIGVVALLAFVVL